MKPESAVSNFTRRLGFRLSLSAIGTEFDLLKNELLPFWNDEDRHSPEPDYIDRATDQQLRANISEIKKRANRILALAEAEETRLCIHMNRHAVAAE